MNAIDHASLEFVKMKISVLQSDAGLTGVDRRWSWLETQARRHAAEGSDLLVVPELFLSGYNVGDLLHSAAEPSDGTFATMVQALARELGISILYGYPERAGAQVYNSAQLVDGNWRAVVNHRKTVLPDGIEPDWFAAGSDFTLVRLGDATVAVMICYECEFPETVRRVSAKGADVVLVVTACGWDQVPRQVVPSRAFENGVFMVYANYCGVENGHAFCGQSCIVDPYGNDLARAGTDEAAITANLDLTLVSEARARLPYLRDHGKVPTDINLPKDSSK